MANTLTSPTRHIDRLIRYVLTEKKDQAKGERWVAASAGNGFVVDANASVKIATDVMRRHRKLVGFVQGYHVIDSYAVDELDPSDPEDFERAQIRAALDAAGGNVAAAARALGVDRGNLHRRLQRLGLKP